MIKVAASLNLNSGMWIRHTNLDSARDAVLRFNDVRLVVMGCDGLYWVVSARDASKLRKVGYETV